VLAQQGKCNAQMSEELKQRGLSRKSHAKPNGWGGEAAARTSDFFPSLCLHSCGEISRPSGKLLVLGGEL